MTRFSYNVYYVAKRKIAWLWRTFFHKRHDAKAGSVLKNAKEGEPKASEWNTVIIPNEKGVILLIKEMELEFSHSADSSIV